MKEGMFLFFPIAISAFDKEATHGFMTLKKLQAEIFKWPMSKTKEASLGKRMKSVMLNSTPKGMTNKATTPQVLWWQIGGFRMQKGCRNLFLLLWRTTGIEESNRINLLRRRGLYDIERQTGLKNKDECP